MDGYSIRSANPRVARVQDERALLVDLFDADGTELFDGILVTTSEYTDTGYVRFDCGDGCDYVYVASPTLDVEWSNIIARDLHAEGLI